MVQMSCVIGVPDPYKMQKVKAFVMLASGVEPTQENGGQAHAPTAASTLPNMRCLTTSNSGKTLPTTLVGKVAYRELEDEEEARLNRKEERAGLE